MEFSIYVTHIFVCACLLSSVTVSGCPGFPTILGNITREVKIEVGSSVDIVCSLFPNVAKLYNVSSSNLILKKVQKPLKENVTILDELSVSLQLQNADVSDSGRYNCYLEIPSEEVPKLICPTSVSVGYKPENVSFFMCESFNNFNLTCQWSLPSNMVETKYTLFYEYGRQQFRCPQKASSPRSCYWTPRTDPLYVQFQKELKFVLTGNNSLGENEQHFYFNHSAIVRPGSPLLDITVEKFNFTMVFDPPDMMKFSPLSISFLYELCYRVRNSNKICKIYENKTTQMFATPYTNYSFTLRCKSKDAGSDMWSQFSEEKIITTIPDVPYLAPAVAPSAFISEVSRDNRAVTIYWKPVPEDYHNGPDFCYIVSYFPCEDNLIPEKEIWECRNDYVKLRNLSVDQCYTVHICPRNEVGMSSNCSYINVEAASKLSPPVDAITVLRTDDGFYNVSWYLPTTENASTIHNYTVFWCKSDIPLSPNCKGSIDWLYTKNNSTVLLNLYRDVPYNFAVSANYGRNTSGMKPATCVLLQNSSMQVEFGGIHSAYLKTLSSTSMEVQWPPNSCSSKNFKFYLISYCAVRPEDDLCIGENKRLNISEPVYDGIVIKGLEPDTRYLVSLTALTPEGWRMESGPLHESTFSDFSPIPLILITVGIAVFCVGFIAAVTIGIHRLKKKIKEERNIVIKLPEGLECASYVQLTTGTSNSESSENQSFESFREQNTSNVAMESGNYADLNAKLIAMSSGVENKVCDPKNSSGEDYCSLPVTSSYSELKFSDTACSQDSPYIKITELISRKASDHLASLVTSNAEQCSDACKSNAFPVSPYIAFDKIPKSSHYDEFLTNTGAPCTSADTEMYSESDHYSRYGLRRNINGDQVNTTRRSASLGSLALHKTEKPYVSISFAAHLNDFDDPGNHKEMHEEVLLPCLNLSVSDDLSKHENVLLPYLNNSDSSKHENVLLPHLNNSDSSKHEEVLLPHLNDSEDPGNYGKVLLPHLHSGGKFTINGNISGSEEQVSELSCETQAPEISEEPLLNFIPTCSSSVTNGVNSSPYVALNRLLESTVGNMNDKETL